MVKNTNLPFPQSQKDGEETGIMAKQSENSKLYGQWNLEEIKNLINIINKNKIKEFDLEQGGMKIRIVTQFQDTSKAQSGVSNNIPQVVPMMTAPMISPSMPGPKPEEDSSPSPGTKKEESPPPPEKKEEDKNIVEIKSPMVGTFYRAPSPESPPYVQAGDRVNPETVLCIVEAMKLMNEIKAEMSGTIVDILVENGQPVEYGQPMFKIKKG